ncbi:FYVE zinc finger domain-containing protein [Ditylenchus destructor]|uniref:FYVE zinc finger domain-containing protein n=1 Tax=Ditylenchus destructor TaxID=166010 RepID=A0AAD4MIM0_9BILA|nr:FYVE zinc finger domain-containing protein [Ditylenchus destructor]
MIFEDELDLLGRRTRSPPAENRYKAAHKRTRSRIECAIGQLKNSWRCLSKLCVKSPAYAAEIIKAVIVLHNRKMDQNPEDLPTQEEEQEDQCPPEEMGTTEARAADPANEISHSQNVSSLFSAVFVRALKLKCVGMEHLEQCELYTIQSLLRLTVIWEFVHLVHDPAKSKVYFVVNGQYKPLSPIFVQVRSQLSLIRNLLHTLTTDQQHDLERCLAWKTVFDMRKSRNQRGGDTGENDSKSSLPRESNLDFGSNMLTDDLLVHRIFVLVCNVADQFEAHFAGEMRHIAKTAADMALSVSQPVDIGGKENEQCFANANNPSTSTEILEQPSNAEETEQPTPLPANNKPRRLLASWVPDDQCKNCTKCKRKFTRFRRRHHCRQCGQIFCGKCAKKKIFLVQLNGKVRVCDWCSTKNSADGADKPMEENLDSEYDDEEDDSGFYDRHLLRELF